MSAPDPYYVFVPRWAVKALAGGGTAEDCGRATRTLKAVLAADPLGLDPRREEVWRDADGLTVHSADGWALHCTPCDKTLLGVPDADPGFPVDQLIAIIIGHVVRPEHVAAVERVSVPDAQEVPR